VQGSPYSVSAALSPSVSFAVAPHSHGLTGGRHTAALAATLTPGAPPDGIISGSPDGISAPTVLRSGAPADISASTLKFPFLASAWSDGGLASLDTEGGTSSTYTAGGAGDDTGGGGLFLHWRGEAGTRVELASCGATQTAVSALGVRT